MPRGAFAVCKLKNRGFLLLEVILTVTILSVGLVSALRSFATSLHTLKISQNLLIANLLLEEKIWQKEEENSQVEGIVPEDEEDELAPPFDAFSYKINFTEQKDFDSLYKSTFEVFWKQRKRQYSTSCITYMRAKINE
jgi:type II secretory pathway pseudopilin PulG